jgi:hypothetical protein
LDVSDGGNVEPLIERQLERLGKTLFDSIDRLEERIEERAAQLAAPRIAAAERRAAEAEQRAERAEQACEQRVGDLHTEMARQYRTLEGRYAKVWWLCQHLPGPLRELVSPMPEAWAKEMLPEKWRSSVARRAAPGYDPGAEADRQLLTEAVKLVVHQRSCSVSTLQRKVRVGFATAQRLLGRLEGLGVVGPARGQGARKVLVSPEKLPDLLAAIDGAALHGSRPHDDEPNLDLRQLIDGMSPEEKILVLEYFAGADPEGIREAAAEARTRYERANGYQETGQP